MKLDLTEMREAVKRMKRAPIQAMESHSSWYVLLSLGRLTVMECYGVLTVNYSNDAVRRVRRLQAAINEERQKVGSILTPRWKVGVLSRDMILGGFYAWYPRLSYGIGF